MKRARLRGRHFISLVFVSGIVAAVAGDKIPIPPFFSQAFPVFSNLGTVFVEEGYLPSFADAPTPTLSPPTATPLLEVTPTLAATNTPSPVPSPTAMPTPTSTMLPPVEDCPEAMPSRLADGMKVVVRKNLNFRSSPEVKRDNLLMTNLVGTELEVMGGGFCNANAESPYLWWQLKGPDGVIGWSAEASAAGNFYFLEPIE